METLLSLFGSLERRDFQGGGKRIDWVATARISADWETTDIITLSAGLTALERKSGVDRFDFKDAVAELRVRAGF